MKVWVVRHEDYGDTEIWTEDTDVLETPMVKEELEMLGTPFYQNERDQFVEDIERIKRLGNISNAYIDERLDVRLVEVKYL
jgi:hypothetical protein